MKRIPLIISLVFFILLGVSISYWVMRLIKPETRKIAVPQAVEPVADVQSVASLFGGVMLVDTNYQLKGIVQANPMDQSVAIIGVDDNPTKIYPFNSEVNPGSELDEVHSSYVLLKGHGGNKRVDLPQEPTSTQITEVTRPPVEAQPSAPQVVNRTSKRNRKLPKNSRAKPSPSVLPAD